MAYTTGDWNIGSVWDGFLGGPSSSTVTETTKPAKGSNTGVIVGGIILGIVVIVGIVLIVRAKRKKKDS